MKKIVFLMISFLFIQLAQAQQPIILKDTFDQFVWHGEYHLLYLDSSGSRMNIRAIQEVKRKGEFFSPDIDAPRLINSRADLWACIKIENTTTDTDWWYFEIYDFHVDSYDAYFLHKDSLVEHFSGGDLQPFASRPLRHKNFIHPVKLKEKEYDLYIRIRSEQPVDIVGVIRKADYLVYYSNNEYLLLAIFYGIVLTISIYYFFIFITVKERMYLYFSLYVTAMGLYSLCNDGLGYQYIWGSYPRLNHYMQAFAMLMYIVTGLLHAGSFLHLKTYTPKLYRAFHILIGTKLSMFLIGVCLYEPLLYFYQFDILILAFIFYSSIVAYRKGYKAARFFILAYWALFIGFSTTLLMTLGLMRNNYITVYGVNFGAVMEMLLLSLAVADRIRLISIEREEAQHEIIIQLKEKEALKDRLNKELEDKVKERTQELEFKNQQLDAFVYKASHDIKGPLRSIMGLANLGLVDIKDKAAEEYFRHIQKSSLRLDSLVTDLLQISKVKGKQITYTKIDFTRLIEEVKESLLNIDGFKDFNIRVHLKQDRDFFSDEKMIYSIFQNLIENAFKYRDFEKEDPGLSIRIEVDKQKTLMEFQDNGVGINKELKDKIFDMFFRASELSAGTGLGLYLVKMAVEKIGGRIQVETEKNKGSSFIIVI